LKQTSKKSKSTVSNFILKMVFTIEHNTFIVMTYFHSGLQNENGHWLYSHSSQFTNNLLKPIPKNKSNVLILHNIVGIVERFVSTGNVGKGKSTGRPPVAIPDVVKNVEEIVEEHPHISIRRLSQQIGFH
jgi:hypothetical protein